MMASIRETSVVSSQVIEVPIAGARLTGQLTLPISARALVIVASADGERLYTRGNELVAARLVDAGFATLVVELLTPEEMAEDAETSELRFNQTLVAARLVRVIAWAREQLMFVGLEIGCIGGRLVRW
jgi:dienelactone hydrolase